jgi:PleD family two-component response regulator
LVILDLHLPNTNIRRLCARLKGEIGRSLAGMGDKATHGGNGNPTAASERTPRNGAPAIILLAETADVASLNDVLALGADDRLYKPIPVNILEMRVRRLLEQRELDSDDG